MDYITKFLSSYNVPKLRYGPSTLNVETCTTSGQNHSGVTMLKIVFMPQYALNGNKPAEL